MWRSSLLATRLGMGRKKPRPPHGGSGGVSAPSPVWDSTPSYSILAGVSSTEAIPVSVANGASITVSWDSPGVKPSWVTLNSGASPTISFSGAQQAADDVSGMVLSATANGQPSVNSPSGSIAIASTAPLWSTAPVFSIEEGATGTFNLPVSTVNSAPITVVWVSPGAKPSWVTFSGAQAQPTIGFNGAQVDVNDVANMVLAATANSQTVNSAAGSITVTPLSVWVVGNHSYQEGAGSTYNVLSTGPSGHTAGGVYGIDPAATALPSGVTLSETGLETYDGAGAQATASGVVYTYHEPGSLPTLTLHSTSAGTFPYLATAFPTEGAVPSGQVIVSPDDSNLRSNVISTWPDGSAKVVTIAGEKAVSASAQTTIRLRPGTFSDTNLTAARVNTLLSSIAIDFGGGAQSITNPNFLSPERTWWANPRVICCRYRLAANVGQLEAVIDVHAFASNRAFVEITIENCKLDANAADCPELSAATYSGATVSVNGLNLSIGNGANSSTGANGTHGYLRAWYVSTWVGNDPGIEVTHDTTSMQSHPMFQKIWKTSDVDLQTLYQNDAYEPWSTERLNVPNMGGTGDAAGIGSFTQWDSRYLQSGSKYARRATIASALAALSCNINTRDTTTGLVPTFTQIGNKERQPTAGQWPLGSGEPAWEHAHSPAVGLMAFLCRPSPVFIEIAQKAAVWQHCYRNFQNTHAYGNMQTRGKAWTLRAFNHAVFVTPDALPWKASTQTLGIDVMLDTIESFKDLSANTLDFVWNFNPEGIGEVWATGPGFQASLFQHHYLAVELHKGAASKVLPSASQSRYDSVAAWAVGQSVRYVNESSGGEWRSPSYYGIAGTSGLGQAYAGLPTWGQMFAYQFTSGSPPAASGAWINTNASMTAWSQAIAGNTSASAPSYEAYFWATLCMAVERGVSGADTAWQTVYGTNPTTAAPNGNLTNLATWAVGGAQEPRWCWLPRNK